MPGHYLSSIMITNPEENLPEFLSGSFIPSPPEIMNRILEATPDLSLIALLICSDMGLSASVLKTINSPFYGLRNKIVSIQQAVALLGLDRVINIVNAQLLLTELKSGEYAENLDDFWNLSGCIAETCVVVGNTLEFNLTDEIYVLGLFHNAGVPLMLKRFPDYMKTLKTAYQQAEKRITDIENEKYQTNHAVVGYLIAKSWQLPIQIREVIRDHHNHDRLTSGLLREESDANMMMVILKIAEHLSGGYRELGKQQHDHEWAIIKPSLLEYLGFSEPDFEGLEDVVHESVGTEVID